MTKGELIQKLIEDPSPMEAYVSISLECTNNDSTMSATLTGIMSGKRSMYLTGDYEESID